MSAVVPRLELRQGQSLVMTQQLQQSIKLLQLSSVELNEYIEQELEKNPLLAREDESEPVADVETHEGEPVDPEAPVSVAADTPAEVDKATGDDEWQGGDEDFASGGESSFETRTHSRMNDEYDEGSHDFAANEITLRDHLINQFTVSVSDPAMRMVGQYLIDLVDEAGYIKEDLSSLATQLGCDDSLIEETFKVLHTFDPPGVCARTLKECLTIQLIDKDRFDPAMKVMLEHLELLASGNITQLGKLCELGLEDVREMCAEIRALNPRPGSLYQHEAVQAVIPDVILKRARGERWQVELNPASLPRILVNRRYHALLTTSKSLGKEERKYVTDQLAVANWLVKALDQRAHTILKVSTEIVAQQDAFFREGIKYLRPLTLKEVAAATELHESTISRVTNSKFMASPRGTFELKYFFNASIQNSSGGEGYSNKTVQFLIKELIDAESPLSPLSDDTIAEQLKARGIDVARRTISKYREIMNIPSSTGRRVKKDT